VHSWSTFGAKTSHGQTRTHKIHHSADLGETTTFPLIVCYMLATGLAPKCHFVLGLPTRNFEIPIDETPTTLGDHNFACKPSIETRFEAKLYPSSRSFQWYVTCHLRTKKLGRFLTFNGGESNCQFDSRPFFWHKLVFQISKWVMRAHFRHLRSKNFSNGIKNSSIHWVLTPVIAF